MILLLRVNTFSNKAFIDTSFRPGIASPLSAHLHRPTTAKREVIYKTGST